MFQYSRIKHLELLCTELLRSLVSGGMPRNTRVACIWTGNYLSLQKTNAILDLSLYPLSFVIHSNVNDCYGAVNAKDLSVIHLTGSKCAVHARQAVSWLMKAQLFLLTCSGAESGCSALA